MIKNLIKYRNFNAQYILSIPISILNWILIVLFVAAGLDENGQIMRNDESVGGGSLCQN